MEIQGNAKVLIFKFCWDICQIIDVLKASQDLGQIGLTVMETAPTEIALEIGREFATFEREGL